MKHTESQTAAEKLAQLRSNYLVELVSDWGEDNGSWKDGSWSIDELDKLHHCVSLVASTMGGPERFTQYLGGVTVKKSEMGSHGGEALRHQVSFSMRGSFSAWTVAHEFAHAWDANHGWRLSIALEKYTGGFTSRLISMLRKRFGTWDAGLQGEEPSPGKHGRLCGCNLAGYFYGDKPSGSNWNFNRKEDFAEAFAMYIGWRNDNELTKWAEGRINRYLLENGAKDPNFGVENWADYRKYFYPENGDYATTKRWKFIDKLVKGEIKVS
jgi:hypothetical protein